MKRIRAVYGPIPSNEDRDVYVVGYSGVTHIVEETENLGSYAIVWLKVFKGDFEFAKMNALHLSEIQYIAE